MSRPPKLRPGEIREPLPLISPLCAAKIGLAWTLIVAVYVVIFPLGIIWIIQRAQDVIEGVDTRGRAWHR